MDSKISTSIWKAEPDSDLCRCCHAEGSSYKNLKTPYFWMDVEKVVYIDMLRECFNIELIEVTDSSQQMMCMICYTCIERLEDAIKFKQQILKCEKKFQEFYMGCLTKGTAFEVPVKQEVMDDEENIEGSSVCFNGANNDPGLADDAAMDDNYQDDADYKPNVEDIPIKVNKSMKRKKSKLASAKVKKKPKVEKVKKENVQEIKDEQVLDTIDGVIKVVKRLVKREVDYKKTANTFECLKCSFTTKTPHCIRSHVRTIHMNIPKYSCPTCDKSFSTLASFTKHKLDDHNIDHRFKCNACDHAFNTKVQLKKHINTFHMLGVKIKCKECDYETFSVESLYKHKFKHKTVKDFQCKFCRKAFARKTTMQLHERIHTGDRRKVCAVCGQAFVQKASLNYHMAKYHPEVAF